MKETPQPPPEKLLDIVRRPFGQLHDLPIDVRWEVTRRHPYYLVFWADALRHRQTPSGDRSDQSLFLHAASLMLGSIGVTGEPIDPATPYEKLVEGFSDPSFLTGSVQPITFRAIVAKLIVELPPAEREAIRSLLAAVDSDESTVAGDDDNREIQKQLALYDLGRIPSVTLDSCPGMPLFFIHMSASQRSITRDLEDQVRLWKARLGLGSSKVQSAKLDGHLEVWDLREGWAAGRYDRSSELTFREVGKRLEISSISTVANRYRAAFEMITGHTFTPELWWRLFGPLKFNRRLGGPAAALSSPILRHLRSPARRPAPDTRITPESGQAHPVGFVEGRSAVRDDVGLTDLVLDIQDLIDRGRTDEEIAKELELGDPEEVAYFRSRSDDLRFI